MGRIELAQAVAVVIGTALVQYFGSKWLDLALNDKGLLHDIAIIAMTLFVIGGGFWLLSRLWVGNARGQPILRTTMTAAEAQEFLRSRFLSGGGGGGGGGVAHGNNAAAGGGGGGGGPGQPGGRGGDAYLTAAQTETDRRSVSTPVGRRAMADFITQEHTYGVHELLNKVPTVHDGGYALVEWAENCAAWLERIFRTMSERGCTPQDIAVIEPLGPPRHVPGYSQENVITHRRDMILERLGRLKELEKRFE